MRYLTQEAKAKHGTNSKSYRAWRIAYPDQKTWRRITRTKFEHPIGFIVRFRRVNLSVPHGATTFFVIQALIFSTFLLQLRGSQSINLLKSNWLRLRFHCSSLLISLLDDILLLFHCTLSSGIYCEGHEVVSHALWIPRVAVPRTNYPNTSTTLIFCTWPSFIYRDGLWDEVNAKKLVQ